MDLTLLMIIYSLLIGLALGSFLNVCIYRIPLKKSIISPPSSCPICGERIRFYDNIPLISYIFLLGKCRHCRCVIPWHYPAVEVLMGLLSLTFFIQYGLSLLYAAALVFASLLVTISFIDLYHKIIPDVFSLPGIALGLAASFLPGAVSWLDSLIGIVVGGGVLYLIAFIYELITKREGMGGGDIKLLAMIGAWMGWKPLPFVVLVSSFTGAIIGFAFILISRKGYRAKIPFGPFLSFGALFCFLFSNELTMWYYELMF